MQHKRLIGALIILAIVCIGLLANTEYLLNTYDEWIDRESNPSYNSGVVSPKYDGGCWRFAVSSDSPCSFVIMTRNSTHRNSTHTARLSTHIGPATSIGGTDYWCVEEVKYGPDIYEKVNYFIEWWIGNISIVFDDYTWQEWNGTAWITTQAWHFECTWQRYLATQLPSTSFVNSSFIVSERNFSLTLYAYWYGYI